VTLAPGTRLGPYEIVSSLGAGGMGEVYRARDAKLNRDVAIKVLPPGLAADADARARFEREAMAVAALSHPNILAIHDFGEASGQHFAVMELLEGQTLRQALEAGPLTPKRATEYARQIAEGLAAAHAKGIVHRDLKPENVFVTRDGHVKILDFGLARQVVPVGAGSGQTMSPTMAGRTEPGMVMGTVGYMAPEQVRGDAIDHRADIFAFGVVLFEMLAGKRPFEGATGAETMTAILREEPPPVTALRDTVPASLERVVDHCLEKQPGNRFQSARDLAFALGGASSTSGRAVVAADAAPSPAQRSSRLPLIAASALLVGAAIGALVYRQFASPVSARPLEVRYLTYSGHDFSPAASPDGRSIAFRSERDGKGRIWQKQLATGTEVALTEGPDDDLPRFSPDGATLLFNRRNGSRFSLFRISLLGGEPRRVMDDALDASWSADGSHIVFMRQFPASPGKIAATGIMVAAADGSGAREVVRIPTGVIAPRWSPDGRRIVFTQTAVGAGSFSIHSADVDTGALETVVDSALGARPWVAEWSGDGHLLHTVGQVAAGKLAGTTGRLVTLQPGGAAARLLYASPDSLGRFAVVDGDRVVVESQTVRQNVAEWSNAASHSLTQGRQADRQPVYSPDGRSILFTSDRSGNLDLWMVSIATGEVRQITDDAADDWDPAFGPDGHLYWSSNRSGHFEIWSADADGSGAHQLTHDGVDAENPSVSPDGKWIVYGSTRPNEAGIWRARSDGSEPKVLARGLYGIPHISPDGQYVLYMGFSSILVSTGVRVVRLSDGAPVDFELVAETVRPTSANVGRARWMPDGHAIAFLGQDEKGVNGIYVQDFVPGRNTASTRRPLTGFDSIVDAETFAVAPDGKRVAISGREMVSSLVLLEQPGLTRAR
jgi:eukaryotic-like serine/threonine-protein kinase